jgi:predicted NBD/HSP70 family sugar kinase
MKIRTGDPEIAREINKALVLDMLRKNDRVSRADIARSLALSKVTVSTIIGELIDSKFVAEQGMGESQENGGRKPILLSLDTAHALVIGVDVGTTSTAVALGDLKGSMLYADREPTEDSHTVEKIAAQVAGLVARAVREAGGAKSRILALGVSAAGIVDRGSGFIHFSPDFGWENVPIRDILERETGLRVIVDNCTRAMTLGEKWYGCVGDARNVFYVNVGFGIGSALIINNRIYDNHSEFGHTPVTRQQVRCHCGKHGCLEAVASGNAIEKQANGERSEGSEGWISARDLAERARGGDEEAGRIFAGAGRYLGRAISMATNLFNPDKIIIGGGVALAGELLLAPLRVEFEAQTMDVIKKHARIELSALGTDAGVLGAIALALNASIFKSSMIDSLRG